MSIFLLLSNNTNNELSINLTLNTYNNNNTNSIATILTTNEAILELTTITQSHHANSTDWGPKRDPLYIVIPITVIYTVTFVCGVLGNLSTCIVIVRNKSMHTATNFYLFSLAVSDLLLLVSGLPPEIYSIWSKYPYLFGEAFCLLQGFAAETSANATVLTITAFTIERYVAICHPFLSHTLSKLNRAIKFVIAIWIIAFCLAVPQAMAFRVFCEQLSNGSINDDHCVCIVKIPVIPHAFEISTLVFFIAPMSLITVLYILIGLQLHRSTVRPSRGNSIKMKHRVCKPTANYCNNTQTVLVTTKEGEDSLQNNAQEEDGRKNFSKNSQATKHVVKMLVAVVVAFFICWAPFHAQRLLAVYGDYTSSHMITAFQVLTYISGVFYYLSTTINPLLYHIMSNKFREAFKNTYRQYFRKRLHHHHCNGGGVVTGGRCYSTLSGRSSQVNSHSNTDSYSRQGSLRYLDHEMARLHDSQRPLVVSFRRKNITAGNQLGKSTKQVTILEGELQEALNTLKNESSNLNGVEKNIPILKNGSNMDSDLSFVEVHYLQPTHICPLTRKDSFLSTIEKSNSRFENLNILECGKSKLRSDSLNCQQSKTNNSGGLSKSYTMPDIGPVLYQRTVEFVNDNELFEDDKKRRKNQINENLTLNVRKSIQDCTKISTLFSNQNGYSDIQLVT